MRESAAPLRALCKLLVCPGCHGSLGWEAESATCADCGHAYEVRDGIPLLLVHPEESEHDEIDHDHGHKQQQAEFFDRHEAEEFEIERPSGSPAWYGWLLGEKLRRSLRGIEDLVQGGSALTVCGGSGMDAEFLAQRGARVIASDISFGAAARARERARRHGFDLTVVVADVERLPFRDRSVGLVYVHDGLHHLSAPANGLREMARVAAAAVAVTEPAQAAVRGWRCAWAWPSSGRTRAMWSPGSIRTRLCPCYGRPVSGV